MDLAICSGKRVLGKAVLHDFTYTNTAYIVDGLVIAENNVEYTKE